MVVGISFSGANYGFRQQNSTDSVFIKKIIAERARQFQRASGLPTVVPPVVATRHCRCAVLPFAVGFVRLLPSLCQWRRNTHTPRMPGKQPQISSLTTPCVFILQMETAAISASEFLQNYRFLCSFSHYASQNIDRSSRCTPPGAAFARMPERCRD